LGYQPFDWVAAPRGTNVAMAYAQFGMNTAFNSTTAGTLPNSNLDGQIGVARYLHYDEAFGHIYLLDFILPFGTLTNGKNTEAGTGRQTLSQDSTFGAYLWLSYDITDALRQTIMPRAVQASLSIGYAGIFGGEQRLDGSPTGVKTGEEQIRANYTQYITPTWQGSITLTTTCRHPVNSNRTSV
jgi:hypothetical protein